MKKLYSFALAAAVTLSASAAMPAHTTPFQGKKEFSANMQMSKDVKTLDAASKIKTSDVRKAKKVSAADLDPEGTYYNTYFQQMRVGPDRLFGNNVDFYRDLFGEGWMWYNFMDNEFDIPCDFTDVELESGATLPAFVITGYGETVGLIEDGVEYYLYLCDDELTEEGKIQVYADDIEFFYVNGELVMPYEGTGIGYFDEEGYGGWIKSPKFYTTNASYECYALINEDGDYLLPEEGRVYTEQNGESLTIYGFLGSDPFTFTLDKESNKAVAVDQVYNNWKWSIGGGDALDMRWTSIANETATNLDKTLHAEYGNANGQGFLTATDLEWVIAYEYQGQVGGFGEAAEINFTFDNEIANPAGVTNVEADNTNAPVEYFNLQGIRVNEPAAGNIYIRRQGTDVQKVVIR